MIYDQNKRRHIEPQKMILSLVLAVVLFAMPLKIEAAQKPGVVDWVDLDTSGIYHAFPGYTSHYLGAQKKAKKRLVKIYNGFTYESRKYLEKELQYDDAGNLIAICEFYGLPEKLSLTESFEYDAKGRMIKRNTIMASGELTGWTTYDYDEQDRLVKMSSYTQEIGDNPGSYFNYYYKDGRVTKTDGWGCMGGNTKGRYVYDKKGNLTKEYRRGILVSKFKYDKLGRLMKHITFSPDGQSVIDDSIFSYDSDGYLTSVLHKNADVLLTFEYEPIQ